ncbi:MAG TPA: TIGR04282 family arsenosugar biosynthesis glycosyltransferase [Saprospiraceae bacterium]|nr:TIGR04282 family arsenosugar biosynthesis glycosyltransferase [Saprospiraceae bacterium]
MDHPTSRALITFVKNPQKGQVKTRLAKTLGDEQALRIYQALLEHTRQVCIKASAQRYLYYSNYIDENDNWSDTAFHKALQPNGDLGERMETAFRQVLKKHDKAIIIGSDCASLKEEIIERAFQLLDDHDFVLGPAMDGGYYLLGMRQVFPSLFENIPWSSKEVADITRQRIWSNGYTLAEVDTLSDIDYEEDWEQYGWKID